MEADSLDRRDFTLMTAMALLGGVTITITGCGGSGYGTSPTQRDAGSRDASGSISQNHGHSAVVTAAQLTAGNGLMLNIQAQADHPHSVELTAAEIDRIGNHLTVSKQSSLTNSATFGAHSHTVTFAPGSGPDNPAY